MKVHESTQIRNVGLVGHGGAGKTSLAEAALYELKITERLGSVPTGGTVSDYDPEEIRRQHSISASVLPLEIKDVKINLIDIPGRRDFVGETRNCLRVCDSALFVIDATSGVETGDEFAWQYAEEFHTPGRFVFINKMDKERADFDAALASVEAAFGRRAVPAALPVGAEHGFRGVIDLIRMKFVEENDRKIKESNIPAELAEAARAARARLVEAAAEGDEELMTKFLDDQPLTDAEVLRGVKESMIEGRMIPVLCGSAAQARGVAPLLALLAEAAPNPLEGAPLDYQEDGGAAQPFPVQDAGAPALYVFKTMADPYTGRLSFFKVMRGRVEPEMHLNNLTRNHPERLAHPLFIRGKKIDNVHELRAGDIGAVAKMENTHTHDTLGNGAMRGHFTPTPMPRASVRMAVIPRGKADEDKIGLGFHRLIEQDPTLHLSRDPEVHQTILEGMGDMHLDVAVHHLKNIAKVEVDLEPPRVPHRETITKKAEGQGKYKKQSGGRGQFGDCWIRFEPLPEGSGFEFEWAIVGGVIPTKFAPAVEKGLREAIERGVLCGAPTVDLKAICYDGSYHDVDSSEMAFKVAASLAFKSVIPKAAPVILEPIMRLTVTAPERYMGDLMGDISGRRGRIQGVSAEGGKQKIEAFVPMAELAHYSRDMRSLTHGAGIFETDFAHYERAPHEVQEKLIAEAEKHPHHEEAHA